MHTRTDSRIDQADQPTRLSSRGMIDHRSTCFSRRNIYLH